MNRPLDDVKSSGNGDKSGCAVQSDDADYSTAREAKRKRHGKTKGVAAIVSRLRLNYLLAQFVEVRTTLRSPESRDYPTLLPAQKQQL